MSRQKVFLARAIIQKPDILLLDESTSNLDIAVQREVLNLIDEIHLANSITMLMVTEVAPLVWTGTRDL